MSIASAYWVTVTLAVIFCGAAVEGALFFRSSPPGFVPIVRATVATPTGSAIIGGQQPAIPVGSVAPTTVNSTGPPTNSSTTPGTTVATTTLSPANQVLLKAIQAAIATQAAAYAAADTVHSKAIIAANVTLNNVKALAAIAHASGTAAEITAADAAVTTAQGAYDAAVAAADAALASSRTAANAALTTAVYAALAAAIPSRLVPPP
ncbi:hypothetical protein BV898_11759 [Hypsibius exemplaris]|uniref:Uncharacterized protein n=1 Tax=Hypsibius exemplaris TaxID=2072580 RepID=A0A1W0WFM6_HYPEX|nr:hypothetical protein BV898_11759 [Hypsibius exemplaris]